jgi:hypothetical protein
MYCIFGCLNWEGEVKTVFWMRVKVTLSYCLLERNINIAVNASNSEVKTTDYFYKRNF